MPCDEVKKTLGYAENKKWAEVLIKDGYTVNDAAQTARNGLKCMSISIATGDFGDLYEAVTGKDICTGEALSYSERILSVAGIVRLNGRIWRGIGKTLSLSPEVRKLAQSTDELIDSAKNLGWKASPKVFNDLGDATKTLSKSGKLPERYITKAEAKALGGDPSKGNLSEVAPGKMIGGDAYKNRYGKLPVDKTYKEADLGYEGGFRGKERIVYSEDGKKIYVTNDHYETFTELQ